MRLRGSLRAVGDLLINVEEIAPALGPRERRFERAEGRQIVDVVTQQTQVASLGLVNVAEAPVADARQRAQDLQHRGRVLVHVFEECLVHLRQFPPVVIEDGGPAG